MGEPSIGIEKEFEAIKAITSALLQFDAAGRQRVLEYALRHLGISVATSEAYSQAVAPQIGDKGGPSSVPPQVERIVDIRSLRVEKQPSTDVQMAAIVAYYLANLAPPDLRKDSIGADDLTEMFVQAGYPLPKEARFTLTNARNAGYLNSVGGGRCKLSPVGHNLVVHGLPKKDNESKPRPSRAKKKHPKDPKSAKTTGRKAAR